jgi:hypothetical protein
LAAHLVRRTTVPLLADFHTELMLDLCFTDIEHSSEVEKDSPVKADFFGVVSLDPGVLSLVISFFGFISFTCRPKIRVYAYHTTLNEWPQ